MFPHPYDGIFRYTSLMELGIEIDIPILEQELRTYLYLFSLLY